MVAQTTAEDLEARLEATTAQLKVKQATLRQLEAKNALLEIGNPNASDEESQHIYTLVRQLLHAFSCVPNFQRIETMA